MDFFDALLGIASALPWSWKISSEKRRIMRASRIKTLLARLGVLYCVCLQVVLEMEIKSWAKLVEEAGMDELVQNLQQFTSWLSSIPGIDEATALASVVDQIEGGKYSAIIFDTAPTGIAKILGI